MHFRLTLLTLLGLLSFQPASAEEATKATLYKDPSCGCCREYGAYLRQNGFDVDVIDTGDLMSIKQQSGVPAELEGCHSTLVGGYVVEGHVPAGIVKRLLQEKPAIRGISLPGMPLGSPGMDGEKEGPFVIHVIPNDQDSNAPKIYATE